MAKKRFLVEIDEPAEYHITEVLGPFGSFPGGSLPGRDKKPLTASAIKDQLERAFRYRRSSFKTLKGKVLVRIIGRSETGGGE